jgi:hypothetical protein
MTPPTEPVPIRRAALGSSWPGVIGTISIVFGAMAMLGGVATLFGPLLMSWIRNIGGAETAGAFAAMDKWEWWTYLSGALGFGVAAVLLAGGIGLVRRRPRSRGVLLTWAAMKLVLGGVASVMGAFIQWDIQSANAQSASVPPGMVWGMVVVSLVIGFAWLAALPIFMLIWLTRPKIKAEIRSWGTPNVRSV